MRRRAVHRVYAEEEQPRLDEDERPGESSGEERSGEQRSGEQRLGGRRPMQPTWHSPQRGRAMAVALFAAGLAFVAALAIHALGGPGADAGRQEASEAGWAGSQGAGWAGSQATSVVASQRVKTRLRSGEAVPLRAHRRRVGRPMWRGAVGVQARQAAPVVAAGSAESEFSFER